MLEILRQADIIYLETENSWQELKRYSDDSWNGGGVMFNSNVNNSQNSISIYSPNIHLKTLKMRWNLDVDYKIKILADHWERGYGDLEWRGLCPERVMPWYFLTEANSQTSGYGVMTGCNAFVYWQMDASGVTFTADLRSGNQSVLLGERELHIATILVYEGKEDESAFTVARNFCSRMCPNPILPKEPIIGSNNWYYAYGNSSHNKILEDSKFVASLAKNINIKPFMVIDDGWQLTSGGGKCNGGPWKGNYQFPDMIKLADEMKKIGVRPGIWMRPLLVSQAVPKEWVRYQTDGGQDVLDPSVKGVLEFIESSIKEIVSWGYELIKHDFTTFDLLGKWGFQLNSQVNGIGYGFADNSRTTAEIILDLYRTIRKASGESMVLGCNTVGHLAAGLVEIQRTGDDTSGKSWERTRRMGINSLAFRMPQHNTFYCTDADCVGITSHIPWELNKQWLDLLAESSTALFISTEPSDVTVTQKEALKKAFEIAANKNELAEPLDWQYTTCPTKWKINGKDKNYQWTDLTESNNKINNNHWWL